MEAGLDATVGKARLSVSAFWSRTYNPYQTLNVYTPFAYNQTSQSALEGCGIAAADRIYDVNPNTGVVSVTSATDGHTVTLPYSTRRTYTANRQYVNGSPVTRYGLEWVAEMPIISNRHTLGLSLRIDGKYYHYRGIDNTLIAGSPNGIGDQAESSDVQPLIGYYVGSNVTSASTASTPTVSNGMLDKGCSLNTTLTARIPRLRLIMTMRLEATLLNYRRNLSDNRTTIALYMGQSIGTHSLRRGSSGCQGQQSYTISPTEQSDSKKQHCILLQSAGCVGILLSQLLRNEGDRQMGEPVVLRQQLLQQLGVRPQCTDRTEDIAV